MTLAAASPICVGRCRVLVAAASTSRRHRRIVAAERLFPSRRLDSRSGITSLWWSHSCALRGVFEITAASPTRGGRERFPPFATTLLSQRPLLDGRSVSRNRGGDFNIAAASSNHGGGKGFPPSRRHYSRGGITKLWRSVSRNRRGDFAIAAASPNRGGREQSPPFAATLPPRRHRPVVAVGVS
jgi:hypothetical protein